MFKSLITLFWTIPLSIFTNLIYNPSLKLVHILTLPLQHLFAYTWNFFHFIYDILSSYETLYIYLSLAALLGSLTGATLFLIYRISISLLKLSPPAIDNALLLEPKRSIQQYRRRREVAKALRERGGAIGDLLNGDGGGDGGDGGDGLGIGVGDVGKRQEKLMTEFDIASSPFVSEFADRFIMEESGESD